MAKTKSPEEEQQQAVEEAAASLADLGWDGPYESPDKLSGESSWRASRPGTHPSEVASSTLEGLVAAVEAKEAALAWRQHWLTVLPATF